MSGLDLFNIPSEILYTYFLQVNPLPVIMKCFVFECVGNSDTVQCPHVECGAICELNICLDCLYINIMYNDHTYSSKLYKTLYRLDSAFMYV